MAPTGEPVRPATAWTEVVVVLADGTEVAVGRVPVAARVDLGTVEGLARMQLAVRRRGARLLLRHPRGGACPLAALLDLVGLTGEMRDAVAEAACLLGADPPTG